MVVTYDFNRFFNRVDEAEYQKNDERYPAVHPSSVERGGEDERIAKIGNDQEEEARHAFRNQIARRPKEGRRAPVHFGTVDEGQNAHLNGFVSDEGGEEREESPEVVGITCAREKGRLMPWHET